MLRAERRRRRRLLGLSAVLALSGLAVTVRDSPVYVAPTSAPVAELAACLSLVAGLPHRLDGRSSRPVTPSTGSAAAWGRPAITLRCGVAPDPHPVSVAKVCLGADGTCDTAVQWFENLDDPTLWQTRVAPRLDVEVPAADGLADVLTPISNATLAR